MRQEIPGLSSASQPQVAAVARLLTLQGTRHGQPLASVVCAVGLGAAAAGAQQLRRRRRAGGRRTILLAQTDLAPSSSSSLDLEASVAEFVPKIQSLKDQAELLRSGELKQVIDTMRSMRGTELGAAFSEVDQLLSALIGAIEGLKDSAIEAREGELRERFEGLGEAEDWSKAEQTQALGYRAERENAVETMMEVHVVGLSHHSAPVEVREKLAVAEAEWNRYAKELVDFSSTQEGYVVPEAAVLSTCNRFELYFASPELKKFSAVECVHAFLRNQSGLSRQELEPYLFTHSGEDAIRHLFEVSSGLDSLVLGEAQILAQVKACHEHSIERPEEAPVMGSGGKMIAKLLNAGIRMGKLARTRTKIGKGSVSVSSAAVELMMARSLADLRKYSNKVEVCILGAGKMSRLLLLALFSKQPDIRVTLVNRSVQNAQAVLADEMVKGRGGSNSQVAPMTEMWDVIKRSDVVFTATASEEPIIRPDDLRSVDRPLMLIDISVPRNVANGCGDIDGVFSYSVDDLKKVVQANADKRQSEVLKTKRLIEDEVTKFKVWQASQGAVPYLAALQAMAENIRRMETEKMSQKLKGLHEKEREAVDKLTRHIVDQLFRPIYYSMKEEEEIEAKKDKIWALKSMFNLEPQYKRGLLTQAAAPTGQLNP